MNMTVSVEIILFLISISFGSGAYDFQDQTSTRANTLLDDADDIQRQLDNEARDRIKYGGHKTIWVLHFPTGSSQNGIEMVTRTMQYNKSNRSVKRNVENNQTLSSFISTLETVTSDWSYKDQSAWPVSYPECGGRSQSPVDLPYNGLIRATGARKLAFKNYAELPTDLMVENDGRTISLRGKWKFDVKPFIYGGAAHGRRYIFYSLTLHWPSEHSVGGLQYPMESQVLHISAEYNTMEEAVNASPKDPLAFLGVANLYRFDNHTEEGLSALLKAAKCAKEPCFRLPAMPLQYYNPPFKEYACYQGSLTTPPCKESVLWLVRGKALSITRSDMELAEGLLGSEAVMPFRVVQPLNDRKTFFFKD